MLPLVCEYEYPFLNSEAFDIPLPGPLEVQARLLGGGCKEGDPTRIGLPDLIESLSFDIAMNDDLPFPPNTEDDPPEVGLEDGFHSASFSSCLSPSRMIFLSSRCELSGVVDNRGVEGVVVLGEE